MKNEFRAIGPQMKAEGSSYSPLQTDGHNYLCPECGGYGYTPSGNVSMIVTAAATSCGFCEGYGVLELTDKRVKEIA